MGTAALLQRRYPGLACPPRNEFGFLVGWPRGQTFRVLRVEPTGPVDLLGVQGVQARACTVHDPRRPESQSSEGLGGRGLG
jgi:hypothetical protein